MTRPTRDDLLTLVLIGFLTFGAGLAIYLEAAWTGFQWRNPKANRMSIYRDFGSVIAWRRLPGYQR